MFTMFPIYPMSTLLSSFLLTHLCLSSFILFPFLLPCFFMLPVTGTDTKKEPRLVIEPGLPHNKEGGYLLSHIALQYHRRKRA